MYKLLFIPIILIIALITYNQVHPNNQAASTGTQALLIAIDPIDGSFKRPDVKQRQTLKTKQQALISAADEFQYRNTLTVHANGTTSGVVNPQFLHAIYATRNASGKIVLHEGKEPASDQPAREVK